MGGGYVSDMWWGARGRNLWALIGSFLLVASLASPALGAPVTIKGTFEIVHGDDFADHSKHSHKHSADEPLPGLEYSLRSDGVVTPLEFSSAPQVEYGSTVSVTGEKHGDKVKVSSYRVEAAPGGGGSKKPPRGGTTANYNGPRDTLVVLIRFAADPGPQKSPDEIRAESFTGSGSSSEYFRESSFGKAWLKGKNDGLASDKDGATGDVTQWMQISGTQTNCSYDQWGSAGRSAAQAAGWDLTGYEHIVHIFPKTTACQFGGIAQIGGTYTWINGATAGGNSRSYVISHEIGHNLTLYHSRSFECTANGVRIAFASNCSYTEYGDVYETMGSGYFQLNARNKPHLGWIPSTSILTVTSGTYTLYPIASPTPSTTERQILRVSRGTSDYLYVEARARKGWFDSSVHEVGALLHTGADPSVNGNSYLIDGDPDTTTHNDAAIELGEAFVDTVRGIYVEVTAIDPTSGAVTVLVKSAYTNSVPTATSPSGAAMTTGTAYTHEGATARDVDKNLMMYQWSWVSCPSTCPSMSGATGPVAGGADDVAGPTFTPQADGNYRLSLKVWDATGASTTITVDKAATTPVVPPPPPPPV